MEAFVFRTSWSAILSGCPAEVRLEVYDAIIRYAQSGTLSELKPMARVAFGFIKADIDRDAGIVIEPRKRGAQAGNTNARKTNKNESKRIKTNKNESDIRFSNDENDKKIENPDNVYLANTTSASIAYTPTKEEKLKTEEKKEIVIKKETKTENDKKKAYGDFVTLSPSEYDKLVALHGETAVAWMIDKLDNYKGSKGVKYKSDYRAILSWVVKEYNNEHGNNQRGIRQGARPSKEERDEAFTLWAAEKLNGTGSTCALWNEGKPADPL